DLMRVMMLGGRRRAVLGTVVAERALDVAALGLIFGVVVLDRGLSFGPLPYVAAAAVFGLALSAIVSRFVPAVRSFAGPVLLVTRRLVSPRGASLLAVSVAVWALEAAVYAVVGSAVGVHLGVTGALYVMALTNLSALVPAAPGYVGTFDAAVLLALRSLHLP